MLNAGNVGVHAGLLSCRVATLSSRLMLHWCCKLGNCGCVLDTLNRFRCNTELSTARKFDCRFELVLVKFRSCLVFHSHRLASPQVAPKMACGATMMPFAISPLEDLHFSPGIGSDFGRPETSHASTFVPCVHDVSANETRSA